MATPPVVEIDEELKAAAQRGDVEFLRKCVAANKPNQYYLTVFPDIGTRVFGNMFHIAAREQQEEFVREVIEGKLLPLEVVKQLLCEHRSKTKKDNPLHLAAWVGNLKIVKMFLKAFSIKEEDKEDSPSLSSHRCYDAPNTPPWLMVLEGGSTPCHVALWSKHEECALEILRMDKESLSNMIDGEGRSIFFLAVYHGLDKIAMEIVSSPYPFSADGPNGENAWKYVARLRSSGAFIEQLLMVLVDGDKGGNIILNEWVKIGQIWPFEHLLKSSKVDIKCRRRFVDHLSYVDHSNGKNNLFHVASSLTYEAIPQAVKIFIEAFKDEFSDWKSYPIDLLPWWKKNEDNEDALHLAVRCQRDQRLAAYLLSLHQECSMAQLLDLYMPKEHRIIFLAIEKNFSEVVKTIISRLDKVSWAKYLVDSYSKKNILHLASTCTDRELGPWLVVEASEFITHPDMAGMTPLDLACDVGATRIVKAMLEKDPSAFDKVPLAWVKACKNGHASVIQTFVDCCPVKFSDHCKQHHDSPLHHIKLQNLTRYEDFLKIQYMKDLINDQDSTGATPLHKAIENRNIFLAEALLNMDNIRYNIKDGDGKIARDMLAQLCKEPQTRSQWVEMCKSVGFDPNLRTSYFERKTDLLEVRNTLSVVAALLATITFTAGFTLPGGLKQETGEAMMVNKAMFAVFLLSDTLSMCFSMVVLISLIWSMVFEPNRSLYLIDRSVGLLRLSLYLTLLAFVSGVYIVTSSKLLWAAILVIVLCSLVGISANRQLLYKVYTLVDNLFSFKKKCRDSLHLMEQGIPLVSSHGERANQDPPSHSQTTEDLAKDEALKTNDLHPH